MATVTASYNWVSGETVTPTKLNTTAAPTVVVADNEVTTAKILDANVTNAKIASGIDASKLTTGTLPIDRIADGAVTPAKLSQSLTLATAKAFNWNGSSSNTSLDFESIPSWVRRITIVFHTLSLSGTADFLVRVGSGSVATSGYSSSWAAVSGGVGDNGSSTAGLIIRSGTASVGLSGIMSVVSTNTGTIWASSHTVRGTNSAVLFGGGEIMLAGALDRVRITSSNGTDTFDAGSVNIMYEG
jgi:hypothetical protein